MNDLIQKYRDNLDTKLVVSAITASILIGGAVFALRRAGFKGAAKIVTAGK